MTTSLGMSTTISTSITLDLAEIALQLEAHVKQLHLDAQPNKNQSYNQTVPIQSVQSV